MHSPIRTLPHRFALLVAVLTLLGLAAHAAAEDVAGEVRVGPRIVFSILAPAGAISAAERAEIVNRRITAILDDPARDPQRLELRPAPDGGLLLAVDDLPVIGVTSADAEASARPLEELADDWLRGLRTALVQQKPLHQRQGGASVRFLSEHRVFMLLVQVSLLLLAAHGCGEIMRRLGQPPVIGHLIGGLVLGRSGLGWFWPDLAQLAFPTNQTQSYLLEVVSWLGVIMLLMLTGLETDLPLIRRQGRPALWASASGLVFPFATGLAIGATVPESVLTSPDSRLLFSLFLATALSISSVPVVAKILMDLGLMRRNVGQIILAAAIVDDTVGWLVIAVVASLAEGGSVQFSHVARAAVGTVLFAAFLATLGRRLVYRFLRWIHRTSTEDVLIGAVLFFVLVSAAVTQFLGVHAVLGAFLAGVVIRQYPALADVVTHRFEAVALGVFAPLFFAVAGLHVDLRVLSDLGLAQLTLVMLVSACAGKILGCYAGGLLGGLGKWEALSLGIGMNARGAMGLIVAILGFSLGILTVDAFSAIVIVALLTTAMTPPLLQWSLRRTVPGAEEAERLAQEERRATSFLAGVHHVLLPTRGGPGALVAARLVGLLHRVHPLELTTLHVGGGAAEEAAETVRRVQTAASTSVEMRSASAASGDVEREILAEAARGYELVVMGCGPPGSGDSLFGERVDRVVLGAGTAVLVVRPPEVAAPPEALSFRHVLLPTSGAQASGRAAELAVDLARASGADLTVLHVLEIPKESLVWTGDRLQEARTIGQEILEGAGLQASAQGLETRTRMLQADAAGPGIVRTALEMGADLVVLGVTRRSAGRLFLGQTLSEVLARVPCTVAVLVV